MLEEWNAERERASELMRSQEWVSAKEALARCLVLRPDWARGYSGLGRLLLRTEEKPLAAREALGEGLKHCRKDDEEGRRELRLELQRLEKKFPGG